MKVMPNSWWANVFNPPKYLSMPAAGFDISDRSIKVVSLEAQGSNYVVRRCFQKEIPFGVIERGTIVDGDRFADLLKSVRAENYLERVVVSLPEERSFVFQLELPWMRRKELREAVELQLEENVPLKSNEVVFDYEVFREPKDRNDHYHLAVSVLPQNFVETYLVALDEAGFKPKVLELETQAVARALVPAESRAAYLLVDVGRTHTGFAVTIGQTVLFTSATDMISGDGFTQNIKRQLNVSFDQAEKIKITQGLRNPHGSSDAPMAMMSMAAALRDEISRIIQYWRQHQTDEGDGQMKILLSGGQASLPGLADYLEASLALPVSVPQPWANVFSLEDSLPPIGRNESLGFATAIGLALRGAKMKYD